MLEFKISPTLIQHLFSVAKSTAHIESNSKFSNTKQIKDYMAFTVVFVSYLLCSFRPELLYQYHVLVDKSCGSYF